jgi:hypothetical protein
MSLLDLFPGRRAVHKWQLPGEEARLPRRVAHFFAPTQDGHRFLLAAVQPGAQPLLKIVENPVSAGHAAEFALQAQERHLQMEERLVITTDFAQEVPVVRAQAIGLVAACGNWLPVTSS